MSNKTIQSNDLLVLSPKGIKELVSYFVKADIPILIWGQTGVGKTQIVKQIAQENGYDMLALYLNQADTLGDLLGLPYVNAEKGITEFLPPPIIKAAEHAEKPTILFLDEINRCRKEFRNAIYRLVQERVLDQRKLNVRIVAAANPSTDKYFDTEEFDEAFLNRFAHVGMKSDLTDWKEFAHRRGVHPTVISFASESTAFSNDPITFSKIVTPRDLIESLSKIVNIIENDKELTEDDKYRLIEESAKAILGIGKGIAYTKMYKDLEKPIQPDEWLLSSKENLSNKLNELISKGQTDIVISSVYNIARIDAKKINDTSAKKIINVLLEQTAEIIVNAIMILPEVGQDVYQKILELAPNEARKLVSVYTEKMDLFNKQTKNANGKSKS